ncbi:MULTISPECIES: DUF2141 domain-containing protein [unclassified Pseudoxanthomonas]|uniref:DUF2141 domain-containing protein n=1 Tax=unclassified Pseudoxanthomonas TaxID=2645906 RepID=UPI0008F44EF3|nr:MULTISPECIES: DUF2141 domain-containing protein [unclassified Pseudoxanthomonas]PPJ43090.1 DUF2141 domain-containing protein [Pseudoxanthomonas sp. KAs_5_3]SFV34158.1 Uncharacterized conserved protein, DUF2141 family [Pseudoxanthomonas sp. YR558]
MNRFARRAFFLSALLAATAGAQAAELTVVLQDVRAQTGLIKVALVDSQAGWDGKAAPVQATGAPPSGDQATFVFKDLKPGAYAVLITHDENGNGQLDTNMMGMPVEGYGFSNNPRVMRKPTWDEARFELVGEATHIDVALR